MKKFGRCIDKFFSGVLGLLVFLVAIILFLPFLILFPTRIEGRRNLKRIKGTGKIIASNHFSNLDSVVLIVKLFPLTFARKFLAKAELGKNCVLRWIFKSFGAILIKRGEADKTATREVLNYLKNSGRLIMFPEGTRNKTDSDDMLQIKSGVIVFARLSGAYIVPLRFTRRTRLFRMNKIVIGTPYRVGDDGKLSTEEEIKKLELKFSELKR